MEKCKQLLWTLTEQVRKGQTGGAEATIKVLLPKVLHRLDDEEKEELKNFSKEKRDEMIGNLNGAKGETTVSKTAKAEYKARDKFVQKMYEKLDEIIAGESE